MPSRIRSEVVDLNGRTPEELASLVAGCRVVFERVFTALGEGDFVRLLFGANTRYNRIKVFRALLLL